MTDDIDPADYLSPNPTPAPPAFPGASRLATTSAVDTDHPLDLLRLRTALAKRAWVIQAGPALRDRLAEALLYPVRAARAALPVLKMKPAKPRKRPQKPTARPRKPGAGRKPQEAKAVLGAGVAQAMRECGLSVAISRKRDGGPSPYLQALAICWEVATGKPAGEVEDLRWITARNRRWEHVPTRRAPPP